MCSVSGPIEAGLQRSDRIAEQRLGPIDSEDHDGFHHDRRRSSYGHVRVAGAERLLATTPDGEADEPGHALKLGADLDDPSSAAPGRDGQTAGVEVDILEAQAEDLGTARSRVHERRYRSSPASGYGWTLVPKSY